MRKLGNRLIILLCIFSTSLLGCSDGGGGGNNVNKGSVENVLKQMGVDTSPTPRKDDSGKPLPDDYSPFGSSNSFSQIDELMILGFPLAASSGFSSELTVLELDSADSGITFGSNVLFAPNPALTPWAISDGANPGTLRVAARGDFDRDGLQELAVLYRAPGKISVELQIYEDQTSSFDVSQSLLISSELVNRLAMASGDFNGDGYDELVIGLVSDTSTQLMFLDNTSGSLNLSGNTMDLAQAFSGSDINLIIKTGNLDYDPSQETVVVINELFQSSNGTQDMGTSRYVIFDDAKANYFELENALIQDNLSNVNRTAIVADVSLGDVDGDNIDEIVFAGLTNFDPVASCNFNYLMIVKDDWAHGHVSLGATEHQANIFGGCSIEGGELRFVHVNTLDIDGDGIAEIQVNQLVFDDFSNTSPWTVFTDVKGTVAVIPDSSLFLNLEGYSGRFNANNSDIVTADLTSDSRQDIILYSQSTNQIEVWGLGNPDKTWQLLKFIEMEPLTNTNDLRPILLPINVNHDSVAITFDDGDYQLIFTEPVLVAVLAAAPCYENLGQNLDVCRTAFGTAKSTSVQRENTFTVTAGVTVGFETEFSALGAKVGGVELLATLKVHASRIKSSAYTLTKRIEYTTGPIEDTVIFATIPLDQYIYRINSHPDPDFIGTKVVISMPRSPLELQVERSFYNANVIEGGPVIESSVFNHQLGQPSTYPNIDEKNKLLATFNGFESDPASVGQGGGIVNLEINVATETGSGTSYGVEFELAVQATAGVVVAGYSVGVSADKSLQIVHGTESIYSGSVANLPARNFANSSYNWGLFTYIKDDHNSGQQFEVLNYWVN